MAISRQEELIAGLWIIATLLAFSNDYIVWGWIFAVKAAFDTASAIYYAFVELFKANQE